MSNDDLQLSVPDQQQYYRQLAQFENVLLTALQEAGLPTESIFVPLRQRKRVFDNLSSVAGDIPSDLRSEAVYISKFVAAVASGLFDAALNYLWDETIRALRQRIGQYDAAYFFDTAISSPERRKRLNSADDLEKIDDSELIYGAKEIGLLTAVGFEQVNHIRFMRNWTSAAHPNQNSITGLQLIDWLETCIREVFLLPQPAAARALNIKRHLENLKSHPILQGEADEMASFFLDLTSAQANNLVAGYFGLYTRADTSPQTRDNLRRFLPYLWSRVDENARDSLGLKYGAFAINNDIQAARMAREFLDIVDASQYVPNDLRASEIKGALENLMGAHREWGNFYSEPACARELQRLVADGSIPPSVNRLYVLTLVNVFLTNGKGIAYNAEPTYLALMQAFSPTQAALAILSFVDDDIASKLQYERCEEKYLELVRLMKPKVTLSAVKELIAHIERFPAKRNRMRDESKMKRAADLAWQALK